MAWSRKEFSYEEAHVATDSSERSREKDENAQVQKGRGDFMKQIALGELAAPTPVKLLAGLIQRRLPGQMGLG